MMNSSSVSSPDHILARVVVAADDPAFVRTLARVLERHEYDVIQDPGARQLPLLLGSDAFDLLLIDTQIAGLDIWRFLAQARTDHRTPKVAALVIADAPPAESALARAGLGPEAVLLRPFSLQRFLEMVRARLRTVRQQDRVLLDLRQHADVIDIFRQAAARGATDEILHLLVRRVARGLRISRCSVLHVDPRSSVATVIAASDDPSLWRRPVRLDDYPEIRHTYSTGEAVLARDVQADPLYADVRRRWHEAGIAVATRSAACYRYTVGGQPAGVFFMRTTVEPPLEQADVRFLEGVVNAVEGPLVRALARERAVAS